MEVLQLLKDSQQWLSMLTEGRKMTCLVLLKEISLLSQNNKICGGQVNSMAK
jgi:hypothetical protein